MFTFIVWMVVYAAGVLGMVGGQDPATIPRQDREFIAGWPMLAVVLAAYGFFTLLREAARWVFIR